MNNTYIKWQDVNMSGNTYINWATETRVSKYTVALSEVAAGYMTIQVVGTGVLYEGTEPVEIKAGDNSDICFARLCFTAT